MPVIANDDMLLTSLTAPWIDIFVVTRAESIFSPVALHCTTMKMCSSQCMRLDPASVLGSREHMRSDVRTISYGFVFSFLDLDWFPGRHVFRPLSQRVTGRVGFCARQEHQRTPVA